MSNILEVKNLSIQFGGLRAVDGLNMTIKNGQLYGLIGPNGAGKTTVFNMLTGVYKPTTGTILLDGQNITGKSAISINKAGIARTFQNIRLFKAMSVLDNVKVGLHNHMNYTAIEGVLRLPRYFKEEKRANEKAMELLKVFGLDGEADQLASNLPYGKQRKLEIARALATDPKLLLLDEPTNHLDLIYQKQIFALVSQWLQTPGRAVVSVVHDLSLARAFGTDALLIDHGKAVACGPAAEVLNKQHLDPVYGMDVGAWMRSLYGQWPET